MTLTPAQHQARRQGIGGSDIAAVLGLSRYRTPYEVWLEKTGQAEPESGESEPAYWGQVLEDVTAREYSKRTGRRVQRVTATLTHPNYPWALAHIDRAILIPGRRAIWRGDHLAGANGILECKTASAWKSREWADDAEGVPLAYQAQCQWYLGITGLDTADVVALIGGQHFLIRTLERDDETIREMFARAEEFWRKHVLERIPPPPVNAADVARMFPNDDGDLIEIGHDTETLEIVNRLKALRAEAKDLDSQIDELTERLKLQIGKHSGLALEGRPLITWKAARPSKRTDWQALAKHLGADDALISQFTTEKPGSRRFLVK